MNHAIRSSTRAHHPSAIIFLSPPQKTSFVRFRQASTMSPGKPENQHNIDKSQNPNEKTGDVMSLSFGEGYATRCDEEGFGGIYGGNQWVHKDENDKKIHENHTDYDESQGSEVKEKEKARHQTMHSNS